MVWLSWEFQLRKKCDRFRIYGFSYQEKRERLNMIKKAVIILTLSCVVGVGLFLRGADIADSFAFFNSEFHQVTKKKNLVKPKSFYSKRRSRVADFKYEQLSFFPVLNDPSLNKVMGLNGRVINKINYSPPPARVFQPRKKIRKKPSVPVSSTPIEKTVLKTVPLDIASVEPEKLAKVARLEPSLSVSQILKDFPILSSHGGNMSGSTLAKSGPVLLKRAKESKTANNSLSEMVSFVVQVSSFRKMQHAEVLRGALQKKGYAAFIGKTELPNNKGTWYRVNVGRYLDRAGAEMAAAKYYREENKRAMVIRQSG
jgi:hypothetical protein